MVGYNDNSCRVLVNNKIINARHVQIVEEGTEIICLPEGHKNENNNSDENCMSLDLDNRNNDDNENFANEVDQNNVKDNNVQNQLNNEAKETTEEFSYVQNTDENLPEKRASSRIRNPVNRFGNHVTHCIYVNYVNANAPNILRRR